MLDFSIIIPTWNRPAALQCLLRGISKLDYPAERGEVLVVNDGGAPISPAALQAMSKFRLRVLHQPNLGPSAARNHAAQQARGEWLAFIDDDCVPHPDWLRALANALCHGANSELSIVGGAVVNGCPENVYSTASQLLSEFLYGYYHVSRGAVSQTPFFTANNMALSRTLFLRHGGFDVGMSFAEDRELCARYHASGIALRYAPGARVVHFRALTPRTFWRQHVQYGAGAFEYHARLRADRRDTLLPEPLPFYLGLVSFPWLRFRAPRALRLTLLLILSQFANLVGFILAGWRARHSPAPAKNIASHLTPP